MKMQNANLMVFLYSKHAFAGLSHLEEEVIVPENTENSVEEVKSTSRNMKQFPENFAKILHESRCTLSVACRGLLTSFDIYKTLDFGDVFPHLLIVCLCKLF